MHSLPDIQTRGTPLKRRGVWRRDGGLTGGTNQKGLRKPKGMKATVIWLGNIAAQAL
jgi:hypothetical protein